MRIKTALFDENNSGEDKENNENSLIEQARQAADNSDWQAYTVAMGGIHTKHKNRPIKLYYDVNINEETGECLQSYYDGELIMKI